MYMNRIPMFKKPPILLYSISTCDAEKKKSFTVREC